MEMDDIMAIHLIIGCLAVSYPINITIIICNPYMLLFPAFVALFKYAAVLTVKNVSSGDYPSVLPFYFSVKHQLLTMPKNISL